MRKPALPSEREAGYQALMRGCGVFECAPRARLIVTGADARRFVNGLVTSDVRELRPGDGSYGFFTNRHGKILADVAIFARDESLSLEVPASRAGAMLDHLTSYKVADRVTMAIDEARDELLLAGPARWEVLEKLLGRSVIAEPWAWERVAGVEVYREELIGVPSVRLGGSSEEVEDLRKAVLGAGVPVATSVAVDAVRVERGRPWFGVDFSEESFPQETGLEDEAVSFSKGCYLGQEVVARIHFRGHVNRHCRGLVAGEGVRLQAGEPVFLDDEEVGSVTTATISPALGATVALGLIHRKAEPGRRVRLANGDLATVTELPLVEAQTSS